MKSVLRTFEAVNLGVEMKESCQVEGKEELAEIVAFEVKDLKILFFPT